MSPKRLLLLLTLAGTVIQQSMGTNRFEDWDLPALETRLQEVDEELKRLPTIAMRSDAGAIGFRSESYLQPRKAEWVQIDLEDEYTIDEIVLVPMIRRDTRNGFQADAFPLAFRIIAGSVGNTEGSIIASFTKADKLLPRTAPLVVDCRGLQASWIRIEAIELASRAWDEEYVFQLSEVMLFSNGQNLAYGGSVTASTSSPGPDFKYAAHNENYLVDGFVPYLMDDYKGEQSAAYFCYFPLDAKPFLTIDLKERHLLNQINLHAIETSDSVPQSNHDGYGMPKHLLIEGANQADFADAIVLVDYRMETIYDSGPVITLHFPGKDCRYLRFTVLQPDVSNQIKDTPCGILGLAEIEVFSGNKNVALGKPVPIYAREVVGRNNLEALTDGRNFFGDLLPFDLWMRQLARRHDLEVERPLILNAINKSYAHQKARLRLMGYLAATLAAGIIIIYLIGRIRGMRQIAYIRKRFAADLHDELGANLHAIGLLSDLAYNAIDSREKLQRIVGEVRAVTLRTSDAVRYCANSQEARDPIGSMKEDMLRIAKRMMHDMHYEITVEGEATIQQLKLRTRTDLFLFYKECLVNISRHSGASRFSARLAADSRRIQLVIEDNGQGYIPRPGADVPPSLKRRGQLMHAQVNFQRPENGGTRITLELKRRRFFFNTK